MSDDVLVTTRRRLEAERLRAQEAEEAVIWATFAAAGCSRTDGGSFSRGNAPAEVADRMLDSFRERYEWRDGSWMAKKEKK